LYAAAFAVELIRESAGFSAGSTENYGFVNAVIVQDIAECTEFSVLVNDRRVVSSVR
jgi:hypothetical protein